jgi:DNA-binding MarR family transcriptional regulator
VNYDEFAIELLGKICTLKKTKPQKLFVDALHGESFAISYIAKSNSDVLPSEIGQAMEVSSARIATILNNLEKKELVTRRIDPQDRRKVLVGITQKGKDYADNRHNSIVKGISQILQELGEHDANECIRLSERITALIQSFEI